MRIKIVAYVDVDPEKWASEYDIDRKDVAQDIMETYSQLPQEHIEQMGLAADEITLFTQSYLTH